MELMTCSGARLGYARLGRSILFLSLAPAFSRGLPFHLLAAPPDILTPPPSEKVESLIIICNVADGILGDRPEPLRSRGAVSRR